MRSLLAAPMLILVTGISSAQVPTDRTMRPPLSAPFAIPSPLRDRAQFNAQRTFEILRAAGVLTPTNVDRPVTISARQPFIDELTYLDIARASLRPAQSQIVMDGADSPNGASAVTLHWNADTDRRYVIDCAFNAGIGDVDFRWGVQSIAPGAPATAERVPIIGARAAIVLPAGVPGSVELRSDHSVELTSCDVTAFQS